MEWISIVCLSACAFVVFVNGQVGTLCRPNERLLMCGGCQKTCVNPAPECTALCRPGCYCDGDQVRNSTGHCVDLADCPPLPASYKLDTTEPRPNDAKCPDHEEYRFCEPCNRTCDNPSPVCPAQCSRGCFCADDLVRDRNGTCVKLENCSNKSLNEIPRKPYIDKPINKPLPYKMTCMENQVYKHCENCEKTCSNPNPQCPAQCARGCFCKDGFYKAPNGQCLELEKCPKAEESMAHYPSVEDCDVDEEYFSCGWCERTCSEPKPKCPQQCTRGCLCRPPLLRHRNGRCVLPGHCKPIKCPDANEEFVCRYGCEALCELAAFARLECPRTRRTCQFGCYCKLGLLRDATTGKCVEQNQCSHPGHLNTLKDLNGTVTAPTFDSLLKLNKTQ